MAYIGTEPTQSKFTSVEYTATAAQTTFPTSGVLPETAPNQAAVIVKVNGLVSHGDSYTIGTTLVFDSPGLDVGDKVEIVWLGIVGSATTVGDNTVTNAKIARAGTSGHVLTSAGTGADATWSSGGIAHASQWHLTGYPTGDNDPLTTWAEQAQLGETYYRGYKRLGDAFTHASGVFTFPATGYWQVTFKLVTAAYGTTLSNYSYAIIKTTVDGGTTWYDNDQAQGQVQRTTSDSINEAPIICQVFFHVSDTSTHKIAFETKQHNSATEAYGISNGRTYTCLYFTRIAAA
jgi:hypothetical protein